MASKTGTGISQSKNFKQLDEALKKSFESIKKEMKSLKEGQHSQGVKIAEAKQTIKDAKADFVTVDKYNILKIKIGELNENMKKVWDQEKKLEDLDRRSVATDEFDKQAVTWNNEIKKMQADLSKLEKAGATESQVKELAKDVTDEFNKAKKAIEELRNIKDSITKDELDKRSKKLDQRAKAVEKEVKLVRKDMKSRITTKQVEKLVDDINEEFDSVKVLVADVQRDQKDLASKKDMKQGFNDVNKDMRQGFHDVSKELGRVERKVDGTEARFDKKLDTAVGKIDRKVDSRIDKMSEQLDKTASSLINGLDNYAESVEDAIDDFAKRTKDRMNRINNDLVVFTKETKKDSKTYAKRKQILNLIDDINKEFDKTKDEIDKTLKQLKDARKTFASKDDLAAAFSGLGSSLKTLHDRTKDQFDDLNKQMGDEISDIRGTLRSESSEIRGMLKSETGDIRGLVKANSQDLAGFRKDVKGEFKQRVMQEELEAELDAIQKEFESMYGQVKGIQQDMFDQQDLKDMNKRLKYHMIQTKENFVEKKNFERLADTVDRIQDLVEMQQQAIKEKKKELRGKNKELKVYARELKAQKKALKRTEKGAKDTDDVEVTVTRLPSKQGNGEHRGWRVFGNFLVGAAFVLVALAIIFFFTGLSKWTDVLSIGAVICFVVGIAIKIIVAVKGNGDDDNGKKYRNSIVRAHKTGKKAKKKAPKKAKAKKTKTKKKPAKRKKPSKAKKKPKKVNKAKAKKKAPKKAKKKTKKASRAKKKKPSKAHKRKR